jgi:hypothetical protein
VLQNKLKDIEEHNLHVSADLEACSIVSKHLESEEKIVQDKMQALKVELELIRKCKEEQSTKKLILVEQLTKNNESYESIQSTLIPLWYV